MSGYDTESHPEFDAELYLRLCGERFLRSREQPNPWHEPVTERARALVAVGAIATPTAQRVVDDYARARTLRGIGPGPRRLPHQRRPTPLVAPLAPHRVIPINRVFDQPWGQLTLRYLSLSDTGTRVAVTLRPDPSTRITANAARGHPGPHSGPFAGGPPTLTISDDRGAAISLGFSGGGNDELWRGHYTTVGPSLAPDTGWIELLGERIDLPAEMPQASIRIEALPDSDPALRHLEHCLEVLVSDRHRPGGSLEDAIDALTACAALAPTADIIAETRAVAAALQLIAGSPSAPATGLAPRWQSVLTRRSAGNGPVGTILIGAATPLFDDISVAVLELDSTSDAFQIDLETTGAAPGNPRHRARLDDAELTYSAIDNQGNHYLGTMNGSSGGGGRHDVQIQFWPPLDPAATHLDLAVTASRTRAVIGISLSWDTLR